MLGAGIDRWAAQRSDREEREIRGGYGGEDRPAEQDAQRIELKRERREGRGGEDAESAAIRRGREKGESLPLSNSNVPQGGVEVRRCSILFSSPLQTLEERLSDSRVQVSILRQGEDEVHAKLSQLQDDLQRSESKSNQLELQLESSRKFLADAKGDSSSADNYLREELSRTKREADQSKERTREMKKTVRAATQP